MLTFRRKHKIDPAELDSVREQVSSLRDELQHAASEREALVRRVHELERARAEALHDLFQMPPPASLSPPPPGFSLHEVHGLALDAATSATEVRKRLDVLSIQVQASDDDARRARELAADMQLRLDSIAGELTSQIDELAGEVELLGRQLPPSLLVSAVSPPPAPPPPPPPPSVEELPDVLDEQIEELDESDDVTHVDLEPVLNGHHEVAAAVEPEVIEELRAGQVRLANEQARYEIAFRADLAALADELRRRPG